jgi:hypothetical protein
MREITMNSEEIFTLSLSPLNRILTAFLFSLPFVFVIIYYFTGDYEVLWGSVVIGIILGAVYPFAPQDYRVNAQAVVVHRLAPDVVIPLNEIEILEMRTVTPSIRTWGAAGFFGSFGWFWSPEIKSYKGYYTRFDNTIVIYRRNNRPVVISPDQPEAFIRAVRNRMGEMSRG